jgi:hypothetical protein
MDGGAGRSDMAVVEARKFLTAEMAGMSKEPRTVYADEGNGNSGVVGGRKEMKAWN